MVISAATADATSVRFIPPSLDPVAASPIPSIKQTARAPVKTVQLKHRQEFCQSLDMTIFGYSSSCFFFMHAS
jgi:hypothetical protein